MLLIIVTLGIIGYFHTNAVAVNQYKADSINLAHQTAAYIDNYMESKKCLISNTEDKMATAGRLILDDKERINNDYLKKIAEYLGISEIWYFTPEGKILYSATGEYIGWEASIGDPIWDFMEDSRTIYHEDIRKDLGSDDYYKISYVEDQYGNFVELAVLEDVFLATTQIYDFQNIVNDLAERENICYVRIIDQNLKTVADSDITDIGHDYSQDCKYQEAIKGNSFATEWYCNIQNTNIMKTVVPLATDEFKGVLEIGNSIESFIIYKQSLVRIIIIFCIVIGLVFLWSKRRYTIRPITQLDNDIGQVEEKGVGFYLPTSDNNAFKGIYDVINRLLKQQNDDITRINSLRVSMEYKAYHDALTGLPNHRYLIKKLDELLQNNQTGLISLLKLNRLEEINNAYGHSYGDTILKTFGERLMEGRKKDIFVSRFVGDTFAIIIFSDANDIGNSCSTLNNFITEPIFINNDILTVDLCIGTAKFPQDGAETNELITKADVALYNAKHNRCKGCVHFASNMLDNIKENNRIYNILNQAIHNKAFKLLYQPIVDTKTRKVVSFEALLRLTDYNISPMKFIKIAEDKGLMPEIGRWVAHQAIRQLSDWNKMGLNIKPVAINFSPKQFDDIGFTDYVHELLVKHAISAEYLHVEITENLFVNNNERTKDFIQNLDEVGIKLSLDDIGAGFTSLNYLSYMPINKAKLDKSINDRYLNIKDYNIIKHLIHMFHDLNLKVVAEGIEDKKQLEILQKINCDFIQGYLFSKPCEPEIAKKMLEDDNDFRLD